MNVMPKLIIMRGLIKELQNLCTHMWTLYFAKNQFIAFYFHLENGFWGSCKYNWLNMIEPNYY
jgi:hypothetical protein